MICFSCGYASERTVVQGLVVINCPHGTPGNRLIPTVPESFAEIDFDCPLLDAEVDELGNTETSSKGPRTPEEIGLQSPGAINVPGKGSGVESEKSPPSVELQEVQLPPGTRGKS